jgi:hypothetical protein
MVSPGFTGRVLQVTVATIVLLWRADGLDSVLDHVTPNHCLPARRTTTYSRKPLMPVRKPIRRMMAMTEYLAANIRLDYHTA